MSNDLTPPRGAPAPARWTTSVRPIVERIVVPLLGLVGLWWAIVLVFRIPPFLLPGPDRVVVALMARWPEISAAALVTGVEIGLGLVCGVAIGVGVAVLMALVPWTARLMGPAIVVIQTLPVFAIAPVLVLWLGFGLASKIVMATLIIFFPVASSFHDGLRRTDPGLLDLARFHRATRGQTFLLLRLPAAVPALISGLRMAATVAPIGAVIGEWVGASQGLGLLMMHANARMQTDVVFAALAVLALLAVGLRAGVDLLTRRAAPWAPESGADFA